MSTVAAAPWGLAWVLLCGLHVLMSRLLPGTAVHDRRVPDWAQVTLGATELTLLAAAVAAAAGIDAMLGSWERRKPGRTSRICSSILRVGVVATFLLLLGSSWALFQATSQFADHRTLSFVWSNRHTMMEYLEGTHLALAGLLAAVAVTVPTAALKLGPRWISRVPERIRGSFARVVLGLAGFCMAAAVAGEALHGVATATVSDPFVRATYPLSKLYRQRRDFGSGPAVHFLMVAVKSGADRELGTSGARAEIQRRPQVTMDEVLAGVDRRALRKPNIVVLQIDSVRADQLRVGGSDRDVMPNLDALAREGRSFVDALSDSTHTNYATPSPFSSHYPMRSRDTHIYPDPPAYPRVFLWDVLKAVGYRTAIASSQDTRWGNMGAYLRTDGLDTILEPFKLTQDDARTVDQAIQWVESVGDQPFMLVLNLQCPHWPFKVPEAWPRRFGKPRDFGWAFVAFPPNKVREVRDLYADSLAYADEQAGRLLETLKRRGLWDKTIVIATSDHGEAFLEHGFAGHASRLYQECLKVPLVFRGPGVAPGVDSRPAQLIDLAPSVLGLLGLPAHPSFQGLNLFGPDFPAVRSRYTVAQTSYALQVAVDRGGLKLISDQELELDLLFDLRRDPGETTDLSQTNPAAAQDLAWRLSTWKQAQFDYFDNPERCRKEYPPILVEK